MANVQSFIIDLLVLRAADSGPMLLEPCVLKSCRLQELDLTREDLIQEGGGESVAHTDTKEPEVFSHSVISPCLSLVNENVMPLSYLTL